MSQRPPRTPYVLLGLLTLLTGGGPVLIYRSIGGGANPRWPPDRPVEWGVFGGVVGTYVVLMGACLVIGLRQWRRTLALARDSQGKPQPRATNPVDGSFNPD
jgi:hypothetical protein